MLPYSDTKYIEDNRYSSNYDNQIRMVFLLEKQLIEIFDYVEPNKDNENNYSLKIYQLFLSVCTEFENMCKLILLDNNYNKNENNLNIHDYLKVIKVMKLDLYECSSPITKGIKIKPFSGWRNSKSLKWYRAYNHSKHNREKYFKEANLKNLINALAALRIVLYAQYGNSSTSNGFIKNTFRAKIDDDYDYIYENNSIFIIIKPADDKYKENYCFNWDSIKNDGLDFEKYDFNNV